MKVLEILSEAKKKAEPPIVLTAEDKQAAKEAISLLFTVQKRLEAHDELFADPDNYGGIGIYSHYIAFRWFGGGGENIPTSDRQFIRQVVKEELKKRPALRRYLAGKIEFEPGEGSALLPWTSYEIGKRIHAAMDAVGIHEVDYSDMVKVMNSLAEERSALHEVLSDEQKLDLMKKLLAGMGYKVIPGRFKGKPCLRVPNDPEGVFDEYAQLSLDSYGWVGNLIDRKGHKLVHTAYGDEQDMVDFLKKEFWDPAETKDGQ